MHDYKQSKKTLLDTVERAGYLNAQFKEHSIIIDKKRHAADITLTVDSGKRYYFGDIHFNQTPFDSDFLHRFVGFKTGEPYHYNSIVQLQDALSASNYFQQVAINSDKNKAQQQQIPIHIELTPRPQHLYSIGAGYGTDTGLRANLGWDERYFNRHGHYITALVSGSQMQNTFLTRYVIPGADPLKSRYEISLASQSLRYPQGNNSTEQFGLNHILKHGFWQQTLGLQYQHQRSPGNRFVSNYLLPTASWQFSNTDRLLFDTRGYRVALNFRGASRAVASSSNFIQSELRGKYIVPVMTKSRILFRGDLGYTTGNALTDLPLSLRFYNGGAQTVRGFSYYALGPGRYLTTGSTELQAAIHDKWYSCFFYDTGNAGDRFPLALERSAGVGLLWVSPVGPLELTLAKVLSQSSHPKRVQFSMGSDL
jgi:translocation and assembly module TamA